MNRADAERRIDAFERNRGARLLGLASHAALPAVIDTQLLHLLRVNYFLDPPDALPYAAEAQILLSPLCTEIDDGLYVIGPEERDVLLHRLVTKYGGARLRDVARLLWEYCERGTPWLERAGLTEAQQLTALNFIDSQRALSWLDRAKEGGPAGDIADERWFVAMRKDLEERASALPGVEPAAETIPALVDLRDALVGLYSDRRTAERMARRVGVLLPPSTSPPLPSTRWQELLDAAWTKNRIPAVLAQAGEDHPENPALARAMQEYWIRATPALRVENGILEPAPPEWKILERYRPVLEASLRAVCSFKLEETDESAAPWGLGFMIGRRTLLTHGSMVGRLERGKRRALLAFADRHPSLPSGFMERHPIDQIFANDLVRVNIEAVERDEPTGACAIKFTGEVPLPTPLKFANSPPTDDLLVGRKVYAMGYPVVLGSRADSTVVKRIIGTVGSLLHVQPGEITKVGGKDQITHNCFTLIGNGGSPLIDLETGAALGLHYAGMYQPGLNGLKEGRAIPLWELINRPVMLRTAVSHTADDRVAVTLEPRVAGMICRIEGNNQHTGCGILIGPDLVLTARHVVYNYASQSFISGLICRFGDERGEHADTATSVAGFIASSPPDDTNGNHATGQPDFAVLRLAAPIGRTRGWLPVPADAPLPPPGSSIRVPWYPSRRPLRVMHGISGYVDVVGIFHFTTQQSPAKWEETFGMSGAPCLDDNLNLVAVLQGGSLTGTAAGTIEYQGATVRPILRALQERGITLGPQGIQELEFQARPAPQKAQLQGMTIWLSRGAAPRYADFATFFTQALWGKAANRDGVVTLGSAFTYILDGIRLTHQSPLPEMQAYGDIREFPLVGNFRNLTTSGKRRALVAATNPLEHFAPLRGTESRARKIADLLEKRGAFEVTLLIAEAVTRSALMKELDRLKGVSDPSDAMLFYFAGHIVRDTQLNTVNLGMQLGDRSASDPDFSAGLALAETQLNTVDVGMQLGDIVKFLQPPPGAASILIFDVEAATIDEKLPAFEGFASRESRRGPVSPKKTTKRSKKQRLK